MANATKKIALASARDMSLDKLSCSQANVRRIKADISVEEPAESIDHRGLIQSLHVRRAHSETRLTVCFGLEAVIAAPSPGITWA
jgi:ParB family chromosome partitioning protein